MQLIHQKVKNIFVNSVIILYRLIVVSSVKYKLSLRL